jgi:hypothetical protein
MYSNLFYCISFVWKKFISLVSALNIGIVAHTQETVPALLIFSPLRHVLMSKIAVSFNIMPEPQDNDCPFFWSYSYANVTFSAELIGLISYEYCY